MGKVRRFATRTIHDVPLTFENEDGERVTEKFSVVYRSYSTRYIDEFTASMEAEKQVDGTVPYSAMLGHIVQSISDNNKEPLTDDSGEPAVLGGDFFASISLDEAKGLYDRIQEDIFPQLASPTVIEPGSKVAASEA